MSGVDLSHLVAAAEEEDERDFDLDHGDEDQFPEIPVTDPKDLPPDEGEGGESLRLVLPPEKMVLGLSASGLSAPHRAQVRHHVKIALDVSVRHSGKMAYSQGAHRFDGITHHQFASKGMVPTQTDCSGWGTWVLYQGLRYYHVRDVVNDQNWLAGYTGTMVLHGKLVVHERNIRLGDLAIYGSSRSNTKHVAVCIGGGMVLSHGSPGVHKLNMHYRPDLLVVRRYI